MTTTKARIERLQQTQRAQAFRSRITDFFAGYFWFIFKNVIGWVFILGSPAMGVLIPGPGGIPLFLIGFALVTFPGKRKLTSRVMRGRGLPIEMELFTFLTAAVAIAGTCVLMWLMAEWVLGLMQQADLNPRRKEATYTAIAAGLIMTGLFTLGVTWLVMRLSLKVLNYVLRGMPLIRRRVRPWLRRRGLHLLPSRRKRTTGGEYGQSVMNDEIIEIDERHHRRLRVAGSAMVLWAKRAIAVGITAAIVYWILKPIKDQWPIVRQQVLGTSISRFVLAAVMFAIFLFVFRALLWRRILIAFGHRLPVWAATRIWSTSELARYLPGMIWQVVGRVYLVKPYGVRGTFCSVSQLLELTIFLLANVLVALACLLYFGIKNLQGPPRTWLFVAAALVPVLLFLLHPRIFYSIINRVTARLGKPQIVQRLSGPQLLAMLIWNVLGLLWQSIAIFVIVQQPLGLIWHWWWVVAGGYCLAWCAGFLAFWAPGGIGVREIIFIGAMEMILPDRVQEKTALLALLAFLSVLLRLWATAGELILTFVSYAIDYRGALGRPDAPGRIGAAVLEPQDVEAVV